jgi:hypothetical protein
MAIFTDILNQGRTNATTTGIIKPGSVEARDWYRDKAKEIRSVRIESLIRQNPSYARAGIRPGYMYLFQYDPKFKETLPFYDRYPLVFPFESQGDSFLGMNLHYLPHIYRARLMDMLYDMVSNQKYDDTTRLRVSYQLLNSAARYKYFKPCVKRYLYNHVQSRFLLIPANEWDIALFLPLERFDKRSKNDVFKSTRKIINGL